MPHIQFEIDDLPGFAEEVASLYPRKMTKTTILRCLEPRTLVFTVHCVNEDGEYQKPSEFYPYTCITELIQQRRQPLVAKHTATLTDDDGLIRHVKPLAQLGLIVLPMLHATHVNALVSKDGFTREVAYPLTWSISANTAKDGVACPFIEIELPVKTNKIYGEPSMTLPPILQLRPVPLTANILKHGHLLQQ